MNWNNSTLVFDQDREDYTEDFDQKMMPAFMRYTNHIQKHPEKNVWYDNEDGVCYGVEQTWFNSSSRNSYFISDRDNFINNNRWNIDYLLQYYDGFVKDSPIMNKEIIYSNHKMVESFKDSKILIVGGGPSTLTVNWRPEDYDFVWSCNHFYLNEKLKDTKVSLATVVTEVDLSEANTEFYKYIKDNNTLICFEDRFTDNQKENFDTFFNTHAENAMFSHTRYRGKIGSVPRLLCMATLFGAKQVDVVGMDGMSRQEKVGDETSHSFETNKKRKGTCNYNLYLRHHNVLWDYLLNDIGKNTKFQNLGEGHPINMTTDISRQLFPLENK